MRVNIYSLVLILSFWVTNLSGQTNFEATIDGSQANAGAGTGSLATGSATLTLNAAQDALVYTITLSGVDLDGNQTPAIPGDDVTSMHFHFAPPGLNGGVVFGLIGPNHDVDDLVVNPAAGTISGIWENTDFNPLSAQLNNLMDGNLYINVHTVTVPGGEIRGQVVLAAPIPTLSQWGIITLSMVMLIFGVIALKDSIALRLLGKQSDREN